MILYVTSFNEHLYNATGKNLLESFILHEPEGDLLIAYEGNIDLPEHDRFILHNLDQDSYLQDWLENNKGIIPIRLGGTFEGTFENGFHERTSEWFRKIASLHHAVTLGYEKLVFLDSDVVFNKKLTANKIGEVLDGHAVFYHFGPHRRWHKTGIESGIVGYDLTVGGDEVLKCIFEKYADGSFQNYRRWDDAWMLTVAILENPHIKTKDIVSHSNNSDHVVQDGDLSGYLQHFKGVHWRKHGVKYL